MASERNMTSDERRELFAAPIDNATWPFIEPTPEELSRLPSILRLGCGHESSIGTRLMRAAADEIERLRAHISEIARLEARVKELEGALRPLVAEPVQDEWEAFEAEDEGFIVAIHVPWGDVLRARATLTPTGETDGE